MRHAMLDALKSALNRLRRGPCAHPAQPKPPSPRDTFAKPAPRAPYDPLKPHGFGDSTPARPGGLAIPVVAKARPAAVNLATTPARMSAAHEVLVAMQVGDFVMEMLLRASCPSEWADDLGVQQLQLVAIRTRFAALGIAQRSTFSSLLDEAARDLCTEFPGEALTQLRQFAGTQAGGAMFAGMPQLLLNLEHSHLVGIENPAALGDPHGQAFAACIDRLYPGTSDVLRRASPELLQALVAWFPSALVDEVAAFLRRDAGRSFAHYVQRACWLGIPNALVVQRPVWIRGVRSEMVSMLEQNGIGVPPPWGDIPVYVPSRVKISAPDM